MANDTERNKKGEVEGLTHGTSIEDSVLHYLYEYFRLLSSPSPTMTKFL